MPDPTDDTAELAAAAAAADAGEIPGARRIPGPVRPHSAGPPRDQDRAALEACARVLRTWPDPLTAADVDDALDQIALCLGWTVFVGGHAAMRENHARAVRAQRDGPTGPTGQTGPTR